MGAGRRSRLRRFPEPTPSEFRRGVLVFRDHEKRDAMYRIASHLVRDFWGQPRDLADAIGVLLLTWNQAFYRYGPPDLERLERLLRREAASLSRFRARDIATLSGLDCGPIKDFFRSLLEVLEIPQGEGKGRRSPVAVAKTLHLLAPGFFPLWDKRIAEAYGCRYAKAPEQRYLEFMEISKHLVARLRDTIADLLDGRTPLKVLDEYNYAKFTKGWI